MRLTRGDSAAFLDSQPEMRIVPTRDDAQIFEGSFRVLANTNQWGEVDDTFELRISVLDDADSLPTAWEISGRIPRDGSHHVNPDGSLCLGSPLGLRGAVGREQTLKRFVEKCLVPYLYAQSLRFKGVAEYVFSELDHGPAGLQQDYERTLGVRGATRVKRALQLAALKRRVANKKTCHCGCGRRSGRCESRHPLQSLRKAVPRSFLRRLASARHFERDDRG
jgi:hypothetical protein